MKLSTVLYHITLIFENIYLFNFSRWGCALRPYQPPWLRHCDVHWQILKAQSQSLNYCQQPKNFIYIIAYIFGRAAINIMEFYPLNVNYCFALICKILFRNQLWLRTILALFIWTNFSFVNLGRSYKCSIWKADLLFQRPILK